MELFHRGILGIYSAFVASAAGQNPDGGFASRANLATAEDECLFCHDEINASFTRLKLTYLYLSLARHFISKRTLSLSLAPSLS